MKNESSEFDMIQALKGIFRIFNNESNDLEYVWAQPVSLVQIHFSVLSCHRCAPVLPSLADAGVGCCRSAE